MNGMELIQSLLDIENSTRANLNKIPVTFSVAGQEFKADNATAISDGVNWKIRISENNCFSKNDTLSNLEKDKIEHFLDSCTYTDARMIASFLSVTLGIEAVYGWEDHYGEWFIPRWYDYESHEDWLMSLKDFG